MPDNDQSTPNTTIEAAAEECDRYAEELHERMAHASGHEYSRLLAAKIAVREAARRVRALGGV